MSVLCAKLYFQEVGRRLVDRGVLADPEDYYLFTKDELFDMLDGRAGTKLVRAKATHHQRFHGRGDHRRTER